MCGFIGASKKIDTVNSISKCSNAQSSPVVLHMSGMINLPLCRFISYIFGINFMYTFPFNGSAWPELRK